MNKYYVSSEVNSVMVGDKEYNKDNSNISIEFGTTKENSIDPHKISIKIQTKGDSKCHIQHYTIIQITVIPL